MDFNGLQRVVSRNTLIIFIGLIKVIAQQPPGGWSPQTWQQQPPPQGQAPQQPGQQPSPGQPAQNPSSLWNQQQPPPPGQTFNQPIPQGQTFNQPIPQGQNFNQPPPQGQNFNPNQPQFQVPPQPPTGMWGAPSNGQPPPGYQQNMAAPPNIGWSQYNPQQQMQQPPPGWPMPPPVGVQPAPVPGAPVETNGNHVPQPSQWLPPGHPGHPDATKAAGPWNSKGPIDKNSPKAKLIEAINQMTVAFTQFQTTLEKLMTSLGKLTQLQ